MNLPFDGAIFDLDGTLLDSMGIWSDIDVKFFAERNLPLTDDYAEAITSMSFKETAVYTVKRYKLKETAEEIMKVWHDMTYDAYATEVKLKPHAKELLLNLKERGVRLAVATAIDKELYSAALKNNGIYHLFDSFTSLSEVNVGKSEPDIYLLAAKKIGVKPNRCIVFEDILAGIKSARSAGFTTCGVYDSNIWHEKDKMLANADYYICNFAELPLG